MEYTVEDKYDGAICAWREQRGSASKGPEGLQSVINVLNNRALKNRTSIAQEAVRPWQFSGMTAKGDPNLTQYPAHQDAAFKLALDLMDALEAGTLRDITGGATQYYAESMKNPPYWVTAYTYTVTIAGQRFYRQES